MTSRPHIFGLLAGTLSLAFGVSSLVANSPVLGLLAGLLGALTCFLSAKTSGPERMTVPYQVWHHGEDGSPLISAAAYGGEPSLVDTQSGLLTGRYFQASLENRIAAARRHLRPVSIVLVEIFDGRDRKSQQRSEASYVGDVIRKTMREADIACRLSDGRFAFVLEDTPENGAVWTVERLRRALVADGSERCLWAGIASYPAHAFTAPEVLSRAEVALSSAREWNQDRIEIATSE